MGLAELFMSIGRSLNPLIEWQVMGGGLSTSYRRYAVSAGLGILASSILAAALAMFYMVAVKGLPLSVAGAVGAGVSLIVFVLGLALYVNVPALAARSRGDRLESRFLLFATSLAARVYSGMGLAAALTSMAREERRELRDFLIELDYMSSLISMGKPVHEALELAARLTPSQSLRSLLLGLSAAARTGTGVEEAINAAVAEYLSSRETEIERVTSSLGALMELYMAIAVMLPIALGVVGLLLLFYQPTTILSFQFLMAATTFIGVPVAVISVVLIAESLVSKIKGW